MEQGWGEFEANLMIVGSKVSKKKKQKKLLAPGKAKRFTGIEKYFSYTA